MEVTKEWLSEQSACSEGVKWFLSQKETEGVKVKVWHKVVEGIRKEWV